VNDDQAGSKMVASATTPDRDELVAQRDMLKLEQGAFEHRIRQLTAERDNLLALNRILEADRKSLIEEIMELQDGR
jgi:hypothetical protein